MKAIIVIHFYQRGCSREAASRVQIKTTGTNQTHSLYEEPSGDARNVS